MDFGKQGVTYILLVIPTLFAAAVLGQGVVKMSKNEPDGAVAIGFGVFCFILVVLAYFLFIR